MRRQGGEAWTRHNPHLDTRKETAIRRNVTQGGRWVKEGGMGLGPGLGSFGQLVPPHAYGLFGGGVSQGFGFGTSWRLSSKLQILGCKGICPFWAEAPPLPQGGGCVWVNGWARGTVGGLPRAPQAPKTVVVVGGVTTPSNGLAAVKLPEVLRLCYRKDILVCLENLSLFSLNGFWSRNPHCFSK